MGKRDAIQDGNAPDRARTEVEVEDRAVSLGRAVEFADVPDAEPLDEGLPDIGAHAVADAEPDRMGAVVRSRRGLQHIAAELSDIDDDGAPAADDVGPEVSRREPFADHAGPARQQRHAGAENAAVGMVHGQAIVDPIAGPRPRHAGEGLHGKLHSVMVEVGGLGRPVVPDVKTRTQRSSMVSAGRSSARSGESGSVSRIVSRRGTAPASP